MNVDEIKGAIAKLSREERGKLLKSLTREETVIAREVRKRIRRDSETALKQDRWTSWEDLKEEVKPAC